MSDAAREKILRRKKTEQAMEFAFDNDLSSLQDLVEDADLPLPIDPIPSKDAPDLREDSFLGEAACGGAVDVMKYLLEKGADPNYVGKNARTPLHRALYNEQPASVTVLLEAGADPRLLLAQEKIKDEVTGEYVTNFRPWDPEETNGLNCSKDIKAILKAWNIQKTLSLLSKRAGDTAQKSEQTQKEQGEALVKLQEELSQVEAQLVEATKAHKEAIALRENRIREYDMLKCEKSDKVQQLQMLEKMIHEAEADETNKRMKLEDAKSKARKARVAVREQEVAAAGGLRYDVEASLKLIDDLIAEAKKTTFVVDSTKGNVMKYFTYRPVLLLDLGHSQNMYEVDLRLSILSCLRYGRTLVIWFRDWDVLEAMEEFEQKVELINTKLLRKGSEYKEGELAKLLLGGTLHENGNFSKLLTEDLEKTRPEFSRSQFQLTELHRLNLVFLSENLLPPQPFLDRFYSLNITS